MELVIAGVNRKIVGFSPRSVVSRIQEAFKMVPKDLNPFRSTSEIWDFCNAVWTQRDPKRSVVSIGPEAETANAALRRADLTKAYNHHITKPEYYGAQIWLWLNTFPMRGQFDKKHWIMTIERITKMLDPSRSHSVGCSKCYAEWKDILSRQPYKSVDNEQQAAKWVFDAHNQVNYKLGKPKVTWNAIVQKYAWDVPLN